MKLPFKSIRWRLQAWHAVLLLLVLLGFGLRSYLLTRDNRLAVFDRTLLREGVLVSAAMQDLPGRAPLREAIRKTLMGRFLGRVQRDLRITAQSLASELGTNTAPTGGLLERQAKAGLAAMLTSSEHAGFYYVLWQPDGAVALQSTNVPGTLPRPELAQGAGFRPRTRGEYREQTITAADGTQLLVGDSLALEQAGLNRLALRLALTGAVILVLGLAGGWWLASRAIRPIRQISESAAKIAAGNLTERINLSDTDSELGELARVLNSSFDQVQTAFNQLQAALDRQVQFTADASHELRTPVSVVLAEANSALARERTPAEYQEALESCRHAARRMRRLTYSLLTLAGLDSGAARGRHAQCDLAAITLEVIQLLRPLADEHGVTIQSELRAAPCLGDPGQLGQVVTNLVSNAIQYNRPGGEVRVSVSSGLWTSVLNVADTGAGIDAGDLPHIFDRFYRADKSRSQANGHAGLGLAIAKAIVEAHGGEIHAASDPGLGSTFTLTLNRPDRNAAAAPQARSPAESRIPAALAKDG